MPFDTRWRLFLAISRVLLFSLVFPFVFREAAASAATTVALETSPSLNEVTASSDPTRVVLIFSDGAGRPVPQTRVRLRLRAPVPGWWLSTDLPVVEGSRLFEADLPAPGGAAEWEYFFPIRGAYRLEVTAFGEKGEQLQKVFNLRIRENPLRLFYLGSFVVVLLVVGFAAGRSLNHARRRFQSF